jgi:Dipeptidyl aminopeptidases/acylaminoacyl-peptidases
LSGLAVSPDGTRLVTAVATLSPDGKKYVSSLWEIDPTGTHPARRLTRSAQGESQPVFLPDGALLFTSARPDPESTEDKTDVPALWMLPADGGEARRVGSRPGGIETVVAAVDSGRVVFGSPVMPGTTTAEEDEKARRARADAKVSAILHEHYPIRFWDHDLGPAETRVFTAETPRPDRGQLGGVDGPQDLTPHPDGRAHVDEGLAVSPDGTTVALAWSVDQTSTVRRSSIVVIDTATGERRTVAAEPDHEFARPAFLPDGRSLVCLRETMSTFDRPGELTLWLVDLASGQGRDLLPDFPHWPTGVVVAPDGSAVYFTCDEQGHAPVFRVDLASGAVTRLTASGAYTDVVASRDGSWLYALRASIDSPPAPVRLDPTAADQNPPALSSPGAVTALPGRVVEAWASARDGVDVHYWLVLPEGASEQTPAPLLLWIHGGPLNSWNAWSWRWNPWLMAARGYAVLLPDPALSTGYGNEFVQRGWGHWGDRPYHDLIAVTDAVCARDDIDADRTAAMGGSFGGYMANWVAGHTDRFRAIVTHAGLWSLDQFLGTTDSSGYWQREFGDPLHEPERYQANSPHRFAGQIRTPMLVVHGDRDYRVPIGEALHLWYDLMRHDVEAKFLYFPDENHWVLSPGNARVWYQTVHAFLAEHVLGHEWERPELL